MTEPLRVWLEGRSPRPPADLRERLADALGADAPKASSKMDAETVAQGGRSVERPHLEEGTVGDLLEAARSALGSASERTGRVRETAFHLLVADALVTYACEAALETEAPEEALASVLGIGDTT